MPKKSYNPFKMWGSYVGLVIPLLFFLYNYIDCKYLSQQADCGFGLGILFPLIILGSILGFLIGWGIHSIVRASRK